MAVPVHNHSYYSALDGYSSPDEIAARIEALNMPGAFLTDHGTVAGFGAFGKAMAARDLFAGFGMEAYQARVSRKDSSAKKMGDDMYHLVLLAKNKTGYRNLLRISDESNRTGFHYRARVDIDLLRECHEGIIATTACQGSIVCKDLAADGTDTGSFNDLRDVFRDDFYVEIHTYATPEQHELNHILVALAQERSVPLIYANDAHYDVPENYVYHEAFLAAQYASEIHKDKGHGFGPDGEFYHPKCLYIMSEAEVRAHLASHLSEKVVDEAIRNTDELMELCKFTLEKPTLHLPKARLDENYKGTARDKLLELTEEGLQAKGDLPEEYWARAQYELEAIIKAGLHDYFVIVWNFVDWTLQQGYMVGPGRGSVGGSIVAWALGISTIDPIKHELQFERFWNPGRAEGLPDIDVDFESANRWRTLDYLEHKYGDKRVLSICNHSFLWPKSALDKAAMVLKFGEWGDFKRIKALLESTDDAGKLASWEDLWNEEEFPEVAEELERYREKHPVLFDVARAMSGRLSTFSTHASAVVIADVDLPEYLPARLAKAEDSSTKAKELVTQAEMHEVEELGFPKFDLLRLLNLDIIMRAAVLSGEFDDPEE